MSPLTCERLPKVEPYYDGELPVEELREMETHLAVCPACHQEWRSLQSMVTLLQRGDETHSLAYEGWNRRRDALLTQCVPPEEESSLDARIWMKLRHAFKTEPRRSPRRRTETERPVSYVHHFSVLEALTVCSVLILLFGIYRLNKGVGWVPKVYAAGTEVRSWHGNGWKVMHGKRVPWNVWWRKSPYLYREEIGSEVILDDGRRKVHLRPDLRLATVVKGERQTPLLPWGGLVNSGQVLWQNDHELAFRVYESEVEPEGEPTNRATWTLSKSRWLPLTRTMERGEHGKWRTVEHARYVYNTAFPSHFTTLTIPKGMTVLEATPRNDLGKTGALVQTRNNLKVRVEPLAHSPEGLITFAVEAWFAGRPSAGRDHPESDYVVYLPDASLPGPMGRAGVAKGAANTYVRDDRGRSYLIEEMGGVLGSLEMEQRPKRYLLLPLDPISPQESPKYIELPLGVSVKLSKKLSGYDNWGTRETVSEEMFLFRLPVPPVTDLDRFPPQGLGSWRERWLKELPGFLAEERAKALERTDRLGEAAAQYELALRLRTGPTWGDIRKLELAQLYAKLGRKDRATELVEEFIRRDIPRLRPRRAKEQYGASARALLSDLRSP